MNAGEVGRERGQHFAQRLGRSVDRLAVLLSGSDPLAGRRDLPAHPVEHHQRSRPVARGDEAIGEGQPQPVLARAGAADRPPGKGLGVGGPPELEQDQRLFFGPERTEQAANRHAVDGRQRQIGISALGGVPGGDQGREEAQVAVIGADREPRQRALRASMHDLVGNEKQARIGRQLGRRDRPRQAQRQIHPSGADRFGSAFLAMSTSAWLPARLASSCAART